MSETRLQAAMRAIVAWQENPQTTFTSSNILQDFGDDILNALECWHIIEQLRAEEGSGVEIVNDNPDFEGPNSVIVVTRNFVDCRYDGDSVLDCLRKAKAARDASDAIQEASACRCTTAVDREKCKQQCPRAGEIRF